MGGGVSTAVEPTQPLTTTRKSVSHRRNGSVANLMHKMDRLLHMFDHDDLRVVDPRSLAHVNRMGAGFERYDAPPWEFGPNVSTFRCYRSAKLSEHMHKLLAVDVDGLTSVTFEKIFERLLASCNIYVVGGEVRDAVSHKVSHDTDIGFACAPEHIKKIADAENWKVHRYMPERGYIALGAGGDGALEGKEVWLNGPPYAPSWNLEFSPNTLAWDVRNQVLMDSCGIGVSDVKLHVVRIPGPRSTWPRWCVGEPPNRTDPLCEWRKVLRFWKMGLKGYKYELSSFHFVLKVLHASFGTGLTQLEGLEAVALGSRMAGGTPATGYCLLDKLVYFLQHFESRADDLKALMRAECGHDRLGRSFYDTHLRAYCDYATGPVVKAMVAEKRPWAEIYAGKPAYHRDAVLAYDDSPGVSPHTEASAAAPQNAPLYTKLVVQELAPGTRVVRVVACDASEATDWEQWCTAAEPLPIPSLAIGRLAAKRVAFFAAGEAGDSDAALTPHDAADARATLLKTPFCPEVCFVSPFASALQTATIALEARYPKLQAVGKIPMYALETCSHSATARAPTVVAERRLAFEDVSFELLTGAEEDGPDSASTRARADRFLRFLETRPETHVAVVAHSDFIRETLACAIGLGADHAVQDVTTTHTEIWLAKDPRTHRSHWRIPDGQTIAVSPNTQSAQPSL